MLDLALAARRLALVAAVVAAAALPARADTAYDRFAALTKFIAAQKGTFEGFPLRRGRDVAFVYQGKSAGPLAVAGEFNGWSTAALPMRRIGATDVWVVETTLPVADRFEYKLVEGRRSWFQDPLNRKFAYGDFNSVVNLDGSFKSHLELIPGVYAKKLRNRRDVIVYVPAGALESPERFPVLYMHDGQNLFDPEAMWGGWGVDETVDGLVSSGAIRRIFVVGITNTPGRMDEYTPVKDDISDSCDGSAVMGGRAADYADFVVHDVKPMIDRLYPTLADRANTAVLGSSLGGLVSLWMGLTYPQVFRDAGGMSSTLSWGGWCLGNPRVVDLARRKGRIDVAFYLDSGGDASGSGENGDNRAETYELRDLLASQGYAYWPGDPKGTLCHWWEPGAEHNEASWRARMEKPLLFWFHN